MTAYNLGMAIAAALEHSGFGPGKGKGGGKGKGRQTTLKEIWLDTDRPRLQEEGWTCQGCHRQNWSDRASCYWCGQTQGTAVLAKTPGEAFSARNNEGKGKGKGQRKGKKAPGNGDNATSKGTDLRRGLPPPVAATYLEAAERGRDRSKDAGARGSRAATPARADTPAPAGGSGGAGAATETDPRKSAGSSSRNSWRTGARRWGT